MKQLFELPMPKPSEETIAEFQEDVEDFVKEYEAFRSIDHNLRWLRSSLFFAPIHEDKLPRSSVRTNKVLCANSGLLIPEEPDFEETAKKIADPFDEASKLGGTVDFDKIYDGKDIYEGYYSEDDDDDGIADTLPYL